MMVLMDSKMLIEATARLVEASPYYSCMILLLTNPRQSMIFY